MDRAHLVFQYINLLVDGKDFENNLGLIFFIPMDTYAQVFVKIHQDCIVYSATNSFIQLRN